jgi:long-chain acyl-CoA synthetase
LTNLASVATPRVFARSGTAWIEGGAEFGDGVRALAAALASYGLAPGACAAVLGSDGCDTLRAELAVLVAGGALVSVDPSLSDDALSRTLMSFGAVQAIASDEKQLARILRLRPDLPALDLILLMRAEPSERKPAALLAEVAMRTGVEALLAEPHMLGDALAAGEAAGVLSVVGADGKAHSVGRAALEALAERVAKTIGADAERAVLTALPRGSVVRLAAALAVAGRGGTLLLADPAGTPDAGLVERPPNALLVSGASLGRLRDGWQAELEGRSWIGRGVARWSLRQGADRGRGGWKLGLAESLTLRALRERLGGRSARLDVMDDGPSPVDPSTRSFFEAIGLPVHYLGDGGAANSGPVIAAP